MSTHEPLRLFFAIQLNGELRQALSQLINELKKETRENRVKWVCPENLHVTLRFLGNTDPSLKQKLVDFAYQAIRSINPFALQLQNIRFFPSPTAPRAIATDILPTSELFELAHALEEVAARLHFTPETKPYLPHLTLGRILHHNTPTLRDELKLNAHPMLVDRIVLFNSEKTEDGQQIYTPLEQIFLKTVEVNSPDTVIV